MDSVGVVLLLVALVTLVLIPLSAMLAGMAAMVVMVLLRLRAVLGEREKLLDTGVAAAAQVVAIQRGIGKTGDSYWCDLVLDVHTTSGEVVRASVTELIDLLAIPRVQPGCVVEVVYRQGDPQRVLVLGVGPPGLGQLVAQARA